MIIEFNSKYDELIRIHKYYFFIIPVWINTFDDSYIINNPDIKNNVRLLVHNFIYLNIKNRLK